MHLNRHKPYGHVAGLLGVAYAQDGHYFDNNGRWVPDPENPGEPPSQEVSPQSASVVEQPEPVLPATATAPASIPKDDMRLKENKALKLQMEAYGEEWQGVAHARKFLGIA